MSALPHATLPADPLTAAKLLPGNCPGLNLWFAGTCICALILNLWMMAVGKTQNGIDFNQFYSAGRLAGTGHLYDWAKLRNLELQRNDEAPTGRLPIVAYGHKILGRLPYETARRVWLIAGIAALLAAGLIWPGVPRLPISMAVASSTPAAMGLYYGQDVSFWLMFFALGLLFLSKQRPVAAGIAFSFCISKYHLAVGLPVMLLAMRNWKALAAGAASVSALIAACFVIEGPEWPIHYFQMLQLPKFSPAPQRMPSLYGIASWLPYRTVFEIAGGALVVLLLYHLCRNGISVGIAGAAAAAAGLLLGHHAFAFDCVLLIPLLIVTIFRPPASFALQAWALLLVAPVQALLLGSPIPWVGQLLAVGFVISALFAGNFSSNARVHLSFPRDPRVTRFKIEVIETELLKNG